MMLWKVVADKCGYDQYDEFVVWADSAASAVELVEKTVNWPSHYGQKWTASLIVPPASGEAEVVLGSFNAG